MNAQQIGCLSLFCAVSTALYASAIVDGETIRTTNQTEKWVSSAETHYSGLRKSVWKDGQYPRDGGRAVFLTPGVSSLIPTPDLEIGAIEVRMNVQLTLRDAGLSMTGANSSIQVSNDATLTISDTTPISGTGANRVTIKSAPGFGFGSLTLFNLFTQFSSLDLESGEIIASRTGENQTVLTQGSVQLSGAALYYKGIAESAGGSASASIATDLGAALNIAPGTGYLCVQKDNQTEKATLTTGPIVRENRGLLEVGGSTLGNQVILKTTQSPTQQNGIVDPWIVSRGQNGDPVALDFLVYDNEKGFVSAHPIYANTLSAGTTAVVDLNGDFTVNEPAHVYALRIVNKENPGLVTINANLKIGDGVRPAGLIVNYSNSAADKEFWMKGDGAIDFGTSEGIIWCSTREDNSPPISQARCADQGIKRNYICGADANFPCSHY